jgi:Flp pilus assembly pilin Flp
MLTKQMIKKTLKALWQDESAQGATEYILLVAVVVGLVMMFKGKIMSMLSGKLDEISSAMGAIKPESN